MQPSADSYRRLLRTDPNNAAAHYSLAHLLWRQGELDEARQEIEAALALDPTATDSLWLLGRIARNQGDFVAAREALGTAARMRGAPFSVQMELGQLLYELGDHAALARAAKAAARASPSAVDRAECERLLGLGLQRLGDLPAAERRLRAAIHLSPNAPWLYSALGGCLYEAGKYVEALVTYEEALRIEPENPIHLAAEAYCLSELGRFEEAREALAQALRRDPSDSDAGAALAGVLLNLDEVGRAVEVAVGVLRRDPDCVAAHHNAAEGYRRLDDPGQALYHARRAALLSGHPRARIGLAQVLLDAGEFAGAEAELRPLLRTPDYAEVAVLLVEALLGQGRGDSALALARESTSADPGSPEAWVALARALGQTGDEAAADAALARAAMLDGSNRWVAWAKENTGSPGFE